MKKVPIGGEALIEGIMMRGPRSNAYAFRKSDGSIILEKTDYLPVGKRHKLFGLPLVRGVVSLIESLYIGIRALMRSADFVEFETEEPTKTDLFLEKIFGEKAKDAAVYFALLMSLGIGVVLFMILPNALAGLTGLKGSGSGLLLNIFEGVVRLLIFFIYVISISKMKDIQRVFGYHGAEHKTIHAYEHDDELTVDNVSGYSVRHPKCGTAFLFLVMVISIIIFSLAGWHTVIINILFRLMLIPLVAGISYEILRLTGKKDNRFTRIISWPGMFIQRFTTREPDNGQIEIAIAAIKSVLEDIEKREGASD